MEELYELRAYIQQRNYREALVLLDEIEAMNYDLQQAIEEVYEISLNWASLQACEGRYDPPELARMVNEEQLKIKALHLVLEAQ